MPFEFFPPMPVSKAPSAELRLEEIGARLKPTSVYACELKVFKTGVVIASPLDRSDQHVGFIGIHPKNGMPRTSTRPARR